MVKNVLRSVLSRGTRRCLSSYVQGKPFDTRETTLNDFLLGSCERDDSALMAAFDMDGKTFTFGEMHDGSLKIAAGLLSMGLKQGDRVAIIGPNQPEWLLLKWACVKAGIPMVCINPLYTARELEYAINKVNVKALVCPRSVGQLNYENIITQMIPDIAEQNRYNIQADNVKGLEKIIFYSTDEPVDGIISWRDLEFAADQSHYDILSSTKLSTYDVANIQFTSGTTGMPKAAALTHYNITNTARAGIQQQNSIIQGFDKNSIVINVLPLYHVFSFTQGSVQGAFMGNANIFPSPGFNSGLAIKSIEKWKGTYLLGTPTMFSDIVNDPIRKEHDVSSLGYAIVGGAPVPPSLVRISEKELDLKIAVGYGMTENTCGTFLVPHGSNEDITVNTVGSAMPGLEAKIIDKEENTLNRGEIGEIVTKGFCVYQGYIGDEQKTKESFTKDGFFKTGDLATMREDGNLKMSGRSKDMIIRGGENIQPTEIENFITTLEQVQDCYVIGVPSRRLGEEVAAYVQLKEGRSLGANDIIAECAKGLARFKVPKYIQFTDEWPTTATGKIKKFELRKRALIDFPCLSDETVE